MTIEKLIARTKHWLGMFEHIKDIHWEGCERREHRENVEEHKLILELAEKAEKYKWHDLRKNPDDLPKKNGEYWLYQYIYFLTSPDPNSERCELSYCCDFFKNGKWLNGYDGGKVIAWREIEPFEEVE